MKHPVRRRLLYLGFQGLQALAECVPYSVVCAIGRAIGRMAYGFLWRYRRLTQQHLQEALGPSVTPAQRRRIARGVFENLGQSVVEWLRMPKLSTKELQQLIACDGVEHVRQALAKGNGAIMLSAHFGNWELIAPYLISLGFHGGVLARRLRYPEYESFLIGMRGNKGVPTLARGSLKDVARLLRTNQLVGVMPDQDVDSLEGVFVNFFGRPAYTPIGPATLSLMAGAPILPCFMIREGSRFRLVIEPPVQIPETRDRAQAMAQLTEGWSRVVESYIRRYPTHWVWMHRRWKTQRPLQPAPSDGVTETPPSSLRQSPPGFVHPMVSWLVAMGAAASLVMGGCAKPPAPDAGPAAADAARQDTAAVKDDEGEAMSSFTLNGYGTEGEKTWDLTGRSAHATGDIITILSPDGVGYDPKRTSYLTASAAQVNQVNQHVRLEHDVIIHTSDGMWLTTPVLHWIPDDHRMASDQSVRIEIARMLIRGRGLEGFTHLKYLQLLRDATVVFPSKGTNAKEGAAHTTITCDGTLTFDYERNIATFQDNVHVQDPGGDLYSDTLVAYLDPDTHEIEYAEALSRVRIHQRRNMVQSDRAIYEPSSGKMTMVGRPSMVVYPSKKRSPSVLVGSTTGFLGGKQTQPKP